jgi:hypothetical protein
MQAILEAAIPVYRKPGDILRRDANNAPVRTTAHQPAGRPFDLAEWVVGTLFVVTGAVFALCLATTG